ncbi:FAD-binding oxidoreductase [Leptolyngbya sp. FACHB-541]|uniref:FAD-binding oxidoreductase n=1 Tax=Leptolyngbya sp. FACHB-541 TaxID=2692810 RepID=UPI001686EE8A|nr:FAD-binding oxidoreductase [Leptolyngbya sp. FACHB-541]MBD1997251.1 FAD-binding oxidoreductase [Leptolyngbya sp. FACHB-541]
MTLTEQILSQLPGDVLGGLRHVDRLWQSYKQDEIPATSVVETSAEPLQSVDWDVVVCGGTLGIMLGCALAQRGWRAAVLERGILRGRDQEWNISRKELEVLAELELLSQEELERAIATQYNPACIRFLDGVELQVKDVLNIGVDPVYLLDTLKAKFLAAGGQLFEHTAFSSATIHPNGVNVSAGEGFTSRLLLDAMGHFSPISQQVRKGQKPDAVCLVVGSCAQGFPENPTGDLFASFTPLQNQCQYFWEAFPARDGRTTYLFTYLDAHTDRPSLEDLFEDYLRLLPEYQNVELEQLTFQRALFGFFPCYRQSPLQPVGDRILPIGDSSGSQSPLSFGGFGAMIRHLRRLTEGINQALEADLLDRSALALLQPYQPNLSVTWLFQRAMSAGVNQKPDPDQINALLSAVFEQMDQLGDRVLKPFLQDVVQFPALSQAMLRTALFHPGVVLRVIPHVGLPALLDWTIHYLNLGVYSLLSPLGQMVEPWTRTLTSTQQYYFHRWLDAWKYGSGGDYEEGLGAREDEG